MVTILGGMSLKSDGGILLVDHEITGGRRIWPEEGDNR